MGSLLLVAAGGALGAVARYGLVGMVDRLSGTNQPWGVLLVNALGGFAVGWIAARLSGRPDAEALRLFLIAGVLGGFTTFSAFSLETMALVERRAWATAAVYVLSSVLLSVGACAAGLWSGRGQAG